MLRENHNNKNPCVSTTRHCGFQTGKLNGPYLPPVTRNKRWSDPDVLLKILAPYIVGTVTRCGLYDRGSGV